LKQQGKTHLNFYEPHACKNISRTRTGKFQIFRKFSKTSALFENLEKTKRRGAAAGGPENNQFSRRFPWVNLFFSSIAKFLESLHSFRNFLFSLFRFAVA